jgi:hypothetical protein
LNTFSYLKWFSRPVNLSQTVQIRIGNHNLLRVIYDLDNNDEGTSRGHLSFNLSSRSFSPDSQPPHDSQSLVDHDEEDNED